MPRDSPCGRGERGTLALVRWIVTASCVLAAVHAAAAQPAPTPGPPAPAMPASADTAPAVDPRNDAVWQLYHEVFAAMMQGQRTRARDLATALLRDHPDHPATRLVRSAQLGLAPGAVDDRADTAEPRDSRETASRGARAELALFQSLHGIAIGIETCVAINCDSGQAILGLPLAGGAIGVLAALSVHDLTSGERALLNSGTVWGAVNAGLLLASGSDHDGKTDALGLIAGQGAGLVVGSALFRLHPTAGQVALASSGGVWIGALTALTHEAIGAGLDPHERALGELIAIDVGIAAGAYAASRWPALSRAQTLVLDAGGIVGAVAGGSLGVLIAGNTSDRPVPGLAAVGAAVGLGAAAYFTRDWSDAGASNVHSYLAPPARGRGGVAGIAFGW